jgi:hypothetical protein
MNKKGAMYLTQCHSAQSLAIIHRKDQGNQLFLQSKNKVD